MRPTKSFRLLWGNMYVHLLDLSTGHLTRVCRGMGPRFEPGGKSILFKTWISDHILNKSLKNRGTVSGSPTKVPPFLENMNFLVYGEISFADNYDLKVG